MYFEVLLGIHTHLELELCVVGNQYYQYVISFFIPGHFFFWSLLCMILAYPLQLNFD